ncbi:hypothetical protein C8F04DRAFT_1196585 [Mycena alexandri]|uniref:Ribonuclease H1 N-terminal domain-containing protein n=1 Tax=Mycena alexandri TaxID=1745969 RepID=A0AAD6WTK8_9AGAR|nr:hypothetical protein C8F04DRAFT_1196585 [Mycena alexandri]
MAAHHDLSPAELAALISPDNHPDRLSAQELDALLGHLALDELQEVVDLLGMDSLARQLPPILYKLLVVTQRLTRRTPSESDDAIDSIIRNMDVLTWLSDESTITDPHTPPPSSPELPTTPARTRPSRSAPPTPQHPIQPPSGARSAYDVRSPSVSVRTVSWLEAGALSQGMRLGAVHGLGSRSHSRSGPHGAYAVFYGGEIGVFDHWADASRSVTGHGLAIHCGFPTRNAASEALEYARAHGWTGDSTPPHGTSPTPLPSLSSYEDNPLNSTGQRDRWYAVCRGVVPGVYRSWLECSLNTVGVKGNLCASFTSRAAAESAYTAAMDAGFVQVLARVNPI